MDLENRTFIVTGGANGIGKATALALVKAGANCVILDLNKSALEHLPKTDNVWSIACDLTDPDAVNAAVAATLEKHTVIHGLINCAGKMHSEPLVSFSPEGVIAHSVENWQHILNANLTSVFNCTAAVVKEMMKSRTKGVIVNVTSISAKGNPGQSAYSAAKAGVEALTATWAKEFSMLGIRVAGLSPGFIDTAATRTALSEPILKEFIKKIPMRRLGTVEEAVNGILWILHNDYFNGKILELDGGLVL